MHGLSYQRVRFLILLGSVFAGTLAMGCSGSRYPKNLAYPQRADLLVKGTPDANNVWRLPPPGDLDEGIVKASKTSEAQPKAWFESVDPTRIDRDDRKSVTEALAEVFGTPALPTVEPKDEKQGAVYGKIFATAVSSLGTATADDVDNLQLDPDTLRKGSVLYRRHCLHCHGVAGDGRGPTAPWVHPHPRDYRQGEYKFMSTAITVLPPKPRRDDLYRTIEKGIEGTSMPAFGLMPKAELDQIVSYVIHLSVRGETEYRTLLKATAENQNDATSKLVLSTSPEIQESGSIAGFVYKQASEIVLQWAASNKEKPNAPPAYPYDDNDKGAVADSIRRGHQLFIGKGICITCHFDFGRQSPYRYDHWGTLVRPRNLTENVYRGGRRPLDLYWRLIGGIKPSEMPQLPKDFTEQQVWDLINFVQNMPYPAMLPDDVRDKVYGSSASKKSAVAQVNR